jgi:RNA polymerase sigma-70 factor, ECF subfamily
MTDTMKNLTEENFETMGMASDHLDFQQVYDAWVTPIYRYLYSRTGNAEDAQDITSQTFISVMQSLPRYHDNGHLEGWLFTIARNKLREHARKNSRAQLKPENIDDLQVASDPGNDPAQVDDLRQLKELIQTLPDDERELLSLRHTAGLPFAEIALVLHKNEAAVKKSLYRLQDRLQKMMEAHND